MTTESVWAEIEQELAWRTEELRLLSNSRNALRKESERDRFRRAQLVMLYAHAEGFCKVALLIYVRALNMLRVKRSDAHDQLVAASFKALFHALQFGDRKAKVFTGALPNDEKLHVFCRQAEFVSKLDALMSERLLVPETVVNTESNLSADVLRRNLYKLGFRADLIDAYSVHLDELANRRHNIAHGLSSDVVRSSDYDRLQAAAFRAMDDIGFAILDALQNRSYLSSSKSRAPEPSLAIGEMR